MIFGWTIIIMIIIFLVLPILLICMNDIRCVFLWLLYFILLICLLPTILFYFELFVRCIPYAVWKIGKTGEFNKVIADVLERRFGIKIVDKKEYGRPVIYLVNHHEKDAILDQLSTLIVQGYDDKTVIVNLVKTGVLKNIFKNINHIPISRKGGRFNNFLNECKKMLRSGHNLIIYPEGKFHGQKKHWRHIVDMQMGSFHLAQQENIPIIPVIISGTPHTNGIYKYKPITIKYLSMIDTCGKTPEQLKEETLNVMNRELVFIE